MTASRNPIPTVGFAGFPDEVATPRKITDNGVLRGALQPIRFGVLAGPVTDIYGATNFQEGDHVAMQFWGNGVIRVTKVDTHLSFPVKAHDVHVYEPDHIGLDFEGGQV